MNNAAWRRINGGEYRSNKTPTTPRRGVSSYRWRGMVCGKKKKKRISVSAQAADISSMKAYQQLAANSIWRNNISSA